MTRLSSPIHKPQARDATGPVSVIGAGVIGACVALTLQRAGCQVTLIDALPPGSGTSYGNAGLISVDSCIPISLPGMVWQAPRWLMNPTGPLAIHPGYLPRALPWLVRWLRAGCRDRVLQASEALHDLHRPALAQYQELLGQHAFEDLIRVGGQIHLWRRNTAPTAADRLVDDIRKRQQIAVKPLDASQIKAILPGLATANHGIAFEKHAHCVNPQRMVQAIVDNFLAEGGLLRHESIQRIEPLPADGFRLWTNAGSHAADRVVVTAGAFAKKLLAPLNVDLPIETERGYHVELPDPKVVVSMPFIHKDLAVAVTPMENGLRFAGTVEFAGLDHPPNPRRTEALLRIAEELFPGINLQGARTWLGYRPSTPDSLPIIDELRPYPGLFLACGHGHTGLTGAPMTARLVADLLTGRLSPIDSRPYSLSRFI